MKYLILLLSSIALFAQGGSLSPTGPLSYTGTTPITVTGSWSSATGAAVLMFDWTSSNSANVTSITLPSAIAANKQIQCGGTFPQNSGRCVIFGVNLSTIANSPVAVLATTPTGTGVISVGFTGVQAADPASVAIASTGSSISIFFANKCDVDANGTVDGADVAAIAKRIVAKPAITPCDFNGDNACDVFDLMVILRAVVGTPPVCSAP